MSAPYHKYDCTTCAWGADCEGPCIGYEPDPELDDGDYNEEDGE